MNSEILLDYLAEAERQVASGQRHIAKQQEIVDQLRRRGRDAEGAATVLRTFKARQLVHVTDRDRLRTELYESD